MNTAKAFAYYNDNDFNNCRWLCNLAFSGLIHPGIYDPRSIVDVKPKDLAGFARVHFFAGIGGWDHALSLARWPSEVPVWTGSCPCQPFSKVGSQHGFQDARHLFPQLISLIRACRPAVVFGEQVARGKLAVDWREYCGSEFRKAGYRFDHAILDATASGRPHQRQRLFWVAHSDLPRSHETPSEFHSAIAKEVESKKAKRHGPDGDGRKWETVHTGEGRPFVYDPEPRNVPLAHGFSATKGWGGLGPVLAELQRMGLSAEGALATLKKASENRRIRLHGYGNAIIPSVAAAFVSAFIKTYMK